MKGRRARCELSMRESGIQTALLTGVTKFVCFSVFYMTSGECSISRSSVHVANRRPLDLLRAHWVELEDRVWADHITGELFKREIISMMDREKIERKARGSRREGAVLLLEIMMTRSLCECVEFAVILSETEGLKDLGEKLVNNAAGGCDLYVPRDL